jgi:hypothetical protein
MKYAIAIILACLTTSAVVAQPMPAPDIGYQSTDQLMQTHGQSLSSAPAPTTSSAAPTPYSRTPNMPPIQMKDPPGQMQPGGVFQ